MLKYLSQGEVKWLLKSDATGSTLSSYLPETVGIAMKPPTILTSLLEEWKALPENGHNDSMET